MITLDGQKIPIIECFKYLKLIIQKDWEIDQDVNHKIKPRLLKWNKTNFERLQYAFKFKRKIL